MRMVRSLVCTALAAACTAGAASGQVVISQVYGGGGNVGAPLNQDFMELHNIGTTPVDISGWILQYGSAAGNFQAASNFTTIPDGTTLAPGQYYLVGGGSGANGAPLPVTVDHPSTINLSGTAGKLVLLSGPPTLSVGSGGCGTLPENVVDLVGYGNASCSEGSPAPGTSSSTAAVRIDEGCADTNNNSSDFISVAPNPRNSSVTFLCGTPPPVGACCINGFCVGDLTESQCLATPGTTWGGAGTSCGSFVCQLPQGSCCIGTTCTVTDEGACGGGIWTLNGVCEPNNPCSGACCVGPACTLTNSADCATAGGIWTPGATCDPDTCPTEVAVQAGDIAYGASVPQNRDAVQQIRAAARVGTWARFNFLQSMEFDNANGGVHNPQGNLLGLNFGANSTTGASLHNLSTNGTGMGETLFQLNGSNPFGLTPSRASGLSVSPNNQLVAMIATDATRVVVLGYNAGSMVGTGSGASITSGSQTDPANFPITNASAGTAWLDDNTVIAYVAAAGSPSVPTIYTIPVTGGVLGTPVQRVVPNNTDVPDASRFLALAYNPVASPFIYALSSGFQTTSITRLSVIDPATWTEVHSIDISTSLNTGREIAIGPDGYLYLGQYGGSGTDETSPLIDRLDLDLNDDGTITLAESQALTDNSTVDYYFKGSANTNSFNGLDVAYATSTSGACCLTGTECTVVSAAICQIANGTFQGAGTTCSPNPCAVAATGACCAGVTCSVTSEAACTGVNTSFAGAGTVCNVPGNHTTPCCKADFNQNGSVTVQDIFDFLGAYFSQDPQADINGVGGVTVQDIFDFLAAYFGGCN